MINLIKITVLFNISAKNQFYFHPVTNVKNEGLNELINKKNARIILKN